MKQALKLKHKRIKTVRFFIIVVSIVCLSVTLTSCGSSKSLALNSARKTSELKPGMSYEQVEDLLGKPKSSQMTNNQWIVRWKLQEMWKGYVPYDMIFDPKTKTLVSWAENEKDFQRSQENLKVIADAVSEAEASSQSGGAKGNASPTGPNDVTLMNQFAVKLYRFSASGGGTTGGSEVILNLCPDGTFNDATESGYSGEGWGNAAQGNHHGTWRITGTMQEGTITTVYSGGEAWEYHYSRVAGKYVYLGSTKYAIAGTPDCK